MSQRLELSLLRAFVAVAEENNFARGAKRLRTSQSAISVRIKRLEDILGTKILARDRSGTRMTHAGETLLAEARDLLKQSDRLVETIRAKSVEQPNKIRIASTQRAMSALTPKLVSLLRSEFPDQNFTLVAQSSPEQLLLVQNGEIDLGIIQKPQGGIDPDTGVRARSLSSEPLVIAMQKGDPLGNKKILNWRDLNGRIMTLAPSQKNDAQFLNSLIKCCQNDGFEPTVDSQDIGFRSILPYVAANKGLALVPESTTETQGIVTRSIKNPIPLEFELIWNTKIAPHIESRIDSLVAGCSDL